MSQVLSISPLPFRNQLFTTKFASFQEQSKTLEVIADQIKTRVFCAPLPIDTAQASAFLNKVEVGFPKGKATLEELTKYYKAYRAAFLLNDATFTQLMKKTVELALNEQHFNLVYAILKNGFNCQLKLSTHYGSDNLLNILCTLHAPLDLIKLCLQKGASPNNALFHFLKNCDNISCPYISHYPIELLQLLEEFHVDLRFQMLGHNALTFAYQKLSHNPNNPYLHVVIHILLKKHGISYPSPSICIQKNSRLGHSPALLQHLSQVRNPRGYTPLIDNALFNLSKEEIVLLLKEKRNFKGIFGRAIKFSNPLHSQPLSQEDALAWEVLYQDICAGRTPLQIDASHPFKLKTWDALRKMIHFPTGRAILLALLKQNRSICITETSTSMKGLFIPNHAKHLPVLITVDLSQAGLDFILIGHELLHALHYFINPSLAVCLTRYSSANGIYPNLNELLTITSGDIFPFCENSLRFESGIPERLGHHLAN